MCPHSMFLQGLYIALLSWCNSHVGSTWSWYMMWSGEIFFRSLERSNFWSAWPSSIDGDLCYRNNSPIAIHAIVLFCRSQFMRSYYFADCDLRDRVISSIAIYVIVLFSLVQGSNTGQTVRSFLLVLGSIPRPDRLFWTSVIHGLCHSPPQMVN